MNVVRCAIVFLLVCAPAVAQDANLFESATAGFSLKKPTGWRFASLEQVTKNRASVRLNDEELEKLVQQQATAPLVVMTKHEEPFDGLNPSFQVLIRPLPASLAGATPKQILELVLPSVQKAYQDFARESPIREFTMSSHAAAESVATYTVRTKEGGVFPTRGRMIVVPRGQFMFLMSASAPPEGEDQSNEAFESVLSSISIAK